MTVSNSVYAIITDTSRMTQGEDNFYKKEAFIQEVLITIKGKR